LCRDGAGSFWICDTQAYPTCVRAEETCKVFAFPERPAGSP